MTVINNVPCELLERCLSSMADAVHFRETGQGRPPEQTCLFEIQELRALLATAQPAADGERLVVSSAPDRIFLIIGVECPDGAKFAELGETPWCEDDIHGNGIEYVRAALPAKAEGVAVPGAWIVGNGNQDKWRMWGDYGPEWTPDRDKALQFARRCDAEAFAAEDEDAWAIVQIAAAPVPPSKP